MTAFFSLGVITNVDIGDYLGSTCALIALGFFILQIKKLRSTPCPSRQQLTIVAIIGFIVSIIAGVLSTFGLFVIAIANTPGWPNGTGEPSGWSTFSTHWPSPQASSSRSLGCSGPLEP